MGSHQEADTKAIQKRDGGYVFTPRAFNIVWGNDSKHWRSPVHTWEGPAEMISIMWFQLSGSLPVIPGKKYSITFKLGFNQGSYGWDAHPIFLMAKIGKGGQYSWKRLKELEGMPGGPIDVPDDSNPFEIEVPTSASDPMLYFGIYEVWSYEWKKGLLVHSAFVKEVEEDDSTKK